MAKIKLDIVPFDVPTHVAIKVPCTGLRQDGFNPTPNVPLVNLDRETVEEICAEFTASVLKTWEAQQRPRGC